MSKNKEEPVQYTNPDGSTNIISSKQISLIDFLEQLEVKKDSEEKVSSLGLFNNLKVNLYEIDGEKWILLSDLTKMLGDSRQAGWIRFNRLSKEWEPYSKTYFLDHYKIMDRRVFLSKFASQHNVDWDNSPGNYILIIPDKEFGEITLFSFKGKKIKAKRINNKLTINLKQLSEYIDGNYSTINKAFQNNDFQEGKHYFTGGGKKFHPKNMTLLGILKLLRHTRTGFAEDFLDQISEHIYNNMNPITIGELLLINKDRKLIPQYLGDPEREWIAEDGDILESRGEMIVDNILFRLKIPHQPKPRVYLPSELEKKFNRTYPLVPDWNIKMTPRTIIEYWGLNTEEYVRNKKWKKEIYNALGIKYINIGPNEPQNIPLLTEKLKRLLK